MRQRISLIRLRSQRKFRNASQRVCTNLKLAVESFFFRYTINPKTVFNVCKTETSSRGFPNVSTAGSVHHKETPSSYLLELMSRFLNANLHCQTQLISTVHVCVSSGGVKWIGDSLRKSEHTRNIKVSPRRSDMPLLLAFGCG